MSFARGHRGAGVFDYALVTTLVGGVALVAANAFAKGPEEALRVEGACVRTFACERSHGASNARSLAPEQRGGAAAAWDGVRAEANITASELGDAVRTPGDVVRGVGFLVEHPTVALEALFAPNAGRPPAGGAPESGSAEDGGRAAARVATGISVASLGRLAKIGAMIGRSGKIDWDLPAAPAAPEDPLADAGAR